MVKGLGVFVGGLLAVACADPSTITPSGGDGADVSAVSGVDGESSQDVGQGTETVDGDDAASGPVDTWTLDVPEQPPESDIPQAEPDLPPTEPEVDPTDAMFDPDRMLEVEVTLDPDDWEALRSQTRTIFDIMGPGCMEGPFEAPFTYFSGTVRVDGELVENVGVRKKGFLGSMSYERPSLKLKFGEYVDDQELQGLKRMTLNNSQQDPSLQRQCLAYDLFRAAGIVSPRCNWAKVTVNDEDLGVYVHVDSLKKPFIRRNFPDETGTLWEGTLSDFRDGWMNTFEQKLNEGTDDASRLWAVLGALEASDEELFDALNAHIDMEQFITFWAMEVMVGHWDGYAGNTNNFYLYERPDDDDRLTFIPWGTDGTFMARNKDEEPFIASVMATGAITRRLYQAPSTRFYYLSRLQSLLDAHWDDDGLRDGIESRRQWLASHVHPEAQQQHTVSTWELQGFVEAQRGLIESELHEGGVDWPHPLRPVLCLQHVGDVQVSYATTWGTLHTTNAFEAGTGTMTGELGDQPLLFDLVGASADEGKNQDEGLAIVGVFGLADDIHMHVLVLQLALGDFNAGTTVPIDWQQGRAGLLYQNLATDTQFQNVGFMSDGVWSLDEAAMTPGAPVTGSASGDLYVWGD